MTTPLHIMTFVSFCISTYTRDDPKVLILAYYLAMNLYSLCARRGHHTSHKARLPNDQMSHFFFIFFIEQLFLIFNQMLSIRSFGRRDYGKHTCEFILILDQWLRRRCRLKKKCTDDARRTKNDQKSSP